MKVLCVIPARGGSKGLKDKNIIDLVGKPLITYTIEAAQTARLVDRIVVSTDCEKIAKVAAKKGIEIVERPKRITTDSAAIEDSLRHAVRYLQAQDSYLPDIVVMLQANVPVRKKGQIDNVINRLISSGADSASTVFAVDQYPQWMKKLDSKGFIYPLYPGAKKFRRQEVEPYYMLDGAIVAIRREVLMRSEGKKGVHVFLGKKIVAVIQDRKYSTEIDQREDVDLARFYLRG